MKPTGMVGLSKARQRAVDAEPVEDLAAILAVAGFVEADRNGRSSSRWLTR